MTPTTDEALERELSALIVESLNLTDVGPDGIEPTRPLFGPGEGGLGLDSIDALELAMALKRRYGISTKADDAKNAQVFRSVRSLAEFVGARRREAAQAAGGST